MKGLNSLRDGHAPIRTFAFKKDVPAWFVCQWNSKYNLKEGNFEKNKTSFRLFDESKSLTVQKDGEMIFTLDASKEYDAPRAPSQPWPHLLIEQEITENNKIFGLKKLVCKASFCLQELENFMGEQEEEHHTTQFVWVITLKDENPSSASYNHFIWVIFPIFDSRYEFSPLFMNQDMALPDGEFIYCFAGKSILPHSVRDKKWTKVSVDLMGHIPTILAAAQSKGYMLGTKMEDLTVSSTNMGFEITGTFACTMRVKDVTITAQRR